MLLHLFRGDRHDRDLAFRHLLGVSEDRGPYSGTPNSRILNLKTSKIKVPPNRMGYLVLGPPY